MSSSEITPEEIARWRELCEKATEPTHIDRYEHGGARVSRIVGDDRTLIADYYEEADREFYIESREALPRLLSALRESEAREAALVAGLRGLTRHDFNNDCGGESGRCITELAPSDGGDWVAASDLDALLREREQRREQRQGGTSGS